MPWYLVSNENEKRNTYRACAVSLTIRRQDHRQIRYFQKKVIANIVIIKKQIAVVRCNRELLSVSIALSRYKKFRHFVSLLLSTRKTARFSWQRHYLDQLAVNRSFHQRVCSNRHQKQSEDFLKSAVFAF